MTVPQHDELGVAGGAIRARLGGGLRQNGMVLALLAIVLFSSGMWPLYPGKPVAHSAIEPKPLASWLRPVRKHERVGEQTAVVCHCE